MFRFFGPRAQATLAGLLMVRADGTSMSTERWVGSEEAARRLGMSSDWIRRQIAEGRLPATVWLTGKRPTYRIRLSDLSAFERRYSRQAPKDPDGA